MSVETILQALAESSGRAALNRGAILGGTVQQLAALPQQIYDDREHQRQVALANLTAAENIRLRQAQEQRDIAATAHQTKTDAEAERAKAAEKEIMKAYTGGNPTDPSQFDLQAAVTKAQEVDPSYIPHLLTVHASLQPKVGRGAPGSAGIYETGPKAGQVIPGSQVPEKPPAASPAEFAATANDPTKTPQERLNALNALKLVQQNPGEQETVRHNQAVEQIGRMTAGRELATQAETARHNKATELANNPFGNLTAPPAGQPAMPTAAPVPGQAPAPTVPAPPGGPPSGPAPDASTAAPGPTGDAFLKTLAPDVASEVKAYAEGRRPFPTGMSMFRLQPLIKLVGQYDPTFDAANYNARNKIRTDLESPSGTGGKTVNALNTAISHAGKLSDLIEALDNTDTPAANAIMNWWNKNLTGGTKVTNFEAVQPQLMKEVERLWRGAGGSQGDIDALKASLGPNMGRQQQREALANFVSLMEGKLQSTEQQRDNALGPLAGKSVPILFDQSKPILQKITQRAAPATSTTAKEGDEQPIPGQPGMTAVFRNGRWIAK